MRYFILISSLILILATSTQADYAEQMVYVPPGTFMMGDGEATCGSQEHEVTLTRGFYLGQHEVTNQEYLEALQWAYDHEYVQATTFTVSDKLDESTERLLDLSHACSEIQFDGAGTFTLRDVGPGIGPDHPVKMVTWFGMVRFCDWLSLQEGLPRAYEHAGDWSCNGKDPYAAEGYRLPTDAEWEYAAQFPDERSFPWGEEIPVCDLANFHPELAGECVGWTVPADGCPEGKSYLSLSNMAGNNDEWCNDWWVCNLGTDPVTDPVGPDTGTLRVFRGGDWWWANEHYVRCASRPNDSSAPPQTCWCNVGFRVAWKAPASEVETEPARGRSRIFLDMLQPNPFTAATRITYTVPGTAPTLLTVYDAAGRRVRTLVNAAQSAGTHSVSWDGTDEAGSPVAAGVYFCHLTVGEQTATRQVQLLR